MGVLSKIGGIFGQKPKKKAPYEFTEEDMELSKSVRRVRAQARLMEEMAILQQAKTELAEAQADFAQIQQELTPKDEMADIVKMISQFGAVAQQQNQPGLNPLDPANPLPSLPLPPDPQPQPVQPSNDMVAQAKGALPPAVREAIRRGILKKSDYLKHAGALYDRIRTDG
jgi:hypothetical protein